jgi:ATP-dependent DNA helicase RecG
MESKTIEQVLELPPDAVGAALLKRREDQWFDRKSVRIKPAKLAETLVGMGNAEGGLVVIGLSDDHVEGVDGEPERVNELRQTHMQHTIPPVRTDATLLPCRNGAGVPDHLLLLSVRSGEAVHTLKSDACFLRVGDETRKLSFHQRQELQYDKGFAQFDSTPVRGVSTADLDRSLLEQLAESLSLTDIDRAMNARGIMDRHGAVTVGGYLLFGTNPQEQFPEAYVRVLRYEGVERGTGARQRLIHDEACAGPIPRQIECAARAIERLAPSRRQLGSSGRFERRTLIPTDAWLEALVNAVIHRSYSLGGDHIRVDIFDNRIEVESPGRFPGIASLGDPRNLPRFARNPRIARVAADLGFGQELGEGIRRMFEEMRLAGYGEPVYQQTQASVRLTLAATLIAPDVAGSLPSRSREVMEYIRNAGGLSTGEVAERLGMSKPAAAVRLRALRDAGYVEWVGKSPQDPRAYWRLASE